MDLEGDSDGKICKLMFARNSAERCNIGSHKARRLNIRIQHNKISGLSTFCVRVLGLCAGRKT